MNSGIYTAYSGMKAQMDALEIAASNLANVNSTGFKGDKSFYTYLNQSLGENQASGDLNAAINRSVQARAALDFSNGAMFTTNRDLDVAIDGDGFLTVETPRGIRYTRNGSLHLGKDAVLSTSDGYPVLGANGRPITLGAGAIHINEYGDVSLDGTQIDRLKVVTFDDLSKLEKEGSSLFIARTSQEPAVKANAGIRSGCLEQSNVNAVSSIVQMVNILRHFEAIQKSVNLEMNEINSKAIEKLGR